MFTLEESALLGRMLRFVAYAIVVTAIGAAWLMLR
jgi:hypothetical protein